MRSGCFGQTPAGVHEMDEHIRSAPVERSMPALLGLLALSNNRLRATSATR